MGPIYEAIDQGAGEGPAHDWVKRTEDPGERQRRQALPSPCPVAADRGQLVAVVLENIGMRERHEMLAGKSQKRFSMEVRGAAEGMSALERIGQSSV